MVVVSSQHMKATTQDKVWAECHKVKGWEKKIVTIDGQQFKVSRIGWVAVK